jgi:hypothetical protein
MKLKNLPLAAIVLAGCAAPMKTVKFDSQPQGAHVFMTIATHEADAKKARNYLGVTPFQWTTKVERDGTFILQSADIPIYSEFASKAIVFTAEPPSSGTNLFTKREVYRTDAKFQTGDKVPTGIFFDLTKP